MTNWLFKWFRREFPQNYILKYPWGGSVIVAVFCFVFAILYQPSATHSARFFSYEMTMAIYCVIAGFTVYTSIHLLRLFRFISPEKPWTIQREFTAFLFVFLLLGAVIYFAAFVVESPADRWNLPTLIDSYKNTILIGILPFLFFSSLNFRYLIGEPQSEYSGSYSGHQPAAEQKEAPITINSPIKKEELSFYTDELLYAESNYNYLNFYLIKEGKVRKEVIRNSISSVEEQLTHIPYIIRTHRAFIVNLKKVESAAGNSLGYRLKLSNINTEIPVSRSKTGDFRALYKKSG